MSAGNNIRAKSKSGTAYLKKRILISSAHKGGKLAAKRAMKTMGNSIVVEKGWVVKMLLLSSTKLLLIPDRV